jgi:hypothetical protein
VDTSVFRKINDGKIFLSIIFYTYRGKEEEAKFQEDQLGAVSFVGYIEDYYGGGLGFEGL